MKVCVCFWLFVYTLCVSTVSCQLVTLPRLCYHSPSLPASLPACLHHHPPTHTHTHPTLTQYLCCELAHLQLKGQLCPLQVFDVAHLAWRMQVACDLDTLISTSSSNSNNSTGGGGGCGGGDEGQEQQQQQESVALEVMRQSASSIMRQLPAEDWVSAQVGSCVAVVVVVVCVQHVEDKE